MQIVRRGDAGPAAAEVRATLVELGLLTVADTSPNAEFDLACERATRAFQQARGLLSDGVVGQETWRALLAARYRFGDRILGFTPVAPMVGDDVHQLQERLLEFGYNVGRPDGVLGPATDNAIRQFQRECGIPADGIVGPDTMRALRRLGRKIVGGRPQLLRESAVFGGAGHRIRGKRLVIDPAHGGDTAGARHGDITEADLCYDIALRLQGRVSAIGGLADLTRGPSNNPEPAQRAAFANEIGADVFISIHIDQHINPGANGVATFHFGTSNGATSTLGERLAGLVQREIVARTGFADCRTHPKTWRLLTATQMPAVQLELGYLTSAADRSRLAEASFRDTVAEALLVAVQRIFLPSDADVATGTLNLRALRELQLL